MLALVNSREMKQYDANTIKGFGVPSMVLMERAALSAADALVSRGIDFSRTLVVCGHGNNGGDGLALGRLLHQRGAEVTVVLDGASGHMTEDTIHQLSIVKQYGIPVLTEIPEAAYTLVVDALFGIGLSREVQGRYFTLIERMNALLGFKLALDIPSGIHGDNGQVMGCAFQADLTVTFAYAKTGIMLYPGYIYAGEVQIVDIGIDTYSWQGSAPLVYALEQTDLSLLPGRKQHSNKGSYGRVLVIAGKHNMAGAAFFSGKAAAVTGCGLVKIFTEEDNRIIIQQLFPEAILETYQRKELSANRPEFLKCLKESLSWADVVVLGPGLGTGENAQILVREVLSHVMVPIILDADALNIIAEKPAFLKEFEGEAIVTPHMGEMARLKNVSISELQHDMLIAAGSFAQEYQVICVLKDARTVTVLPEGPGYINLSGNAGMATAGSGDVLTGILAGLIAQGLEPKLAAPLGVYLHGLSGDVMVRETGSHGMLATDIIEGIRRVMGKETEHEYL